MRSLALKKVLSTAVLLSFGIVSSAQTRPEEAARKADMAWLELVDTAQYEASRKSASMFFRHAVPEPRWEKAIGSARVPLGKLKTRKLQNATSTHSLPGAPDGTYVVIQFQSSFENKQAAIETVTASVEQDGTWHVSGYFIK